jgi:hypothetical protein
VDYLTVLDTQQQGAAATRNRGTAQVKTPFVIWLDADDLLRPTFVEECLKVYQKGTFVYTDWVVNGLVVNTPDCLNPFGVGQEHIITTLMPVVAWRNAGGFDESLDTLEDEDYYRQLAAYGWCGVRSPEPLVEYRRHFGQSLVNLETVETNLQRERVAEKQALFEARYKRYETIMACGCGQPKQGDSPNVAGTRQPNDVLAEALYTPQRQEGPVTRRLYPRTGLKRPLWVDIDDAKTRPDLWRIVAENPDRVAPDVATVQRLAKEAIAREAAVIETPAPKPKRRKRKRQSKA